MSADADLAGLLADGADTVLLAQAGTQTEAGLIRDRVAAAGGQDVPVVSLGTGLRELRDETPVPTSDSTSPTLL
ncbi:MAG: hypothetical protein ACRDPY_50035, partial [Streptosporangiaceae bacterium]